MNKLLKLLLILGIVLIANPSFGQHSALQTETAFMNCIYENVPDKGVKLKQVLNNAEQKLIELKYIKDGSGESYADIYRNLDDMFSDTLKDLGLSNYMATISRNLLTTPEGSKCLKAVFTGEAFKNSKLSLALDLMQSLEKRTDGVHIMKEILQVLTPEDLTHDYYRMITFKMIETMNQVRMDDDEIVELPGEEAQEFTDEELKNALHIKNLADKKVTINDKAIAMEGIQLAVVKYLQKHKAKSIVSFESSRDADYGNFMKVQKQVVAAFDEVREKMAQEKYNTSFKELAATEQEKIKNIYPLRIIENYEN